MSRGRTREILQQMDLRDAKTLFGNDFLGPSEIGNALGATITANEVLLPSKDLERARALGQILVYYPEQTPDGKPLTIRRIVELTKPIELSEPKESLDPIEGDSDSKDGNLFAGHYCKEDIFTQVPVTGWYFFPKEFTPGTTDANYWEQTKILAKQVGEVVFADRSLPMQYDEAIKELRSKESYIEYLLEKDWQEAGIAIGGLAITGLTRPSPVDVALVQAVYRKTNGERLYPDVVISTREIMHKPRIYQGRMIGIGNSRTGKVVVNDWSLYKTDPALGACLVHRV